MLMGVRLLGLTLCAPVFPGIAGLGYCEARIWAMLPPEVCWELATEPSKFDVAWFRWPWPLRAGGVASVAAVIFLSLTGYWFVLSTQIEQIHFISKSRKEQGD